MDRGNAGSGWLYPLHDYYSLLTHILYNCHEICIHVDNNAEIRVKKNQQRMINIPPDKWDLSNAHQNGNLD